MSYDPQQGFFNSPPPPPYGQPPNQPFSGPQPGFGQPGFPPQQPGFGPPGYPPAPKQSSFGGSGGPLTVNYHGVVGLCAIALMIIVGFFQSWNIDWLYFVAATVGYAAVIIALTFQGKPDQRILYGSHIAFFLLVGGLALNLNGFGVQLAIFLGAVALGFVIPFLVTLAK